MASKLRYRSGDTKLRLVPTEANNAYPIEEGDLLYKHPTTGCARPAAAMPAQGSAALGQDAFQQLFLGVALSKVGLQTGETAFKLPDSGTKITGDLGYVQVATAGEFEFDCDATQWKPGDLVGVFADSTGKPSSQKVATAASASLAIGYAAPGTWEARQVTRGTPGGPSMTRVVVNIVSTIFGGGIQNQVAGSGSGL